LRADPPGEVDAQLEQLAGPLLVAAGDGHHAEPAERLRQPVLAAEPRALPPLQRAAELGLGLVQAPLGQRGLTEALELLDLRFHGRLAALAILVARTPVRGRVVECG